MSDHPLATVGDRLRYLADLAGLTLGKLGELASLSHSTLTFSAGANDLKGSTAIAVAEVTGAGVGWIIAGEGDPPEEWSVKKEVAAAQAAKGAA